MSSPSGEHFVFCRGRERGKLPRYFFRRRDRKNQRHCCRRWVNFGGWSDNDCSGKGDCSVKMNSDKTVTVKFDYSTFSSSSSGPSWTPSSGDCSDQFSRRTKGTGQTGPITVNFAPDAETAAPVSGVADTYLVNKGYTAGLRWNTVNAVCCDRSGGGGKDNNWISWNANERAKTSGWYGTNAFQPTDSAEYSRVYGLNCYNDNSENGKGVIVRNPWWQPPPPPAGISIYADPNPVEYNGSTTVYWYYSNPGGNEGGLAMSPTDAKFRDPNFMKKSCRPRILLVKLLLLWRRSMVYW